MFILASSCNREKLSGSFDFSNDFSAYFFSNFFTFFFRWSLFFFIFLWALDFLLDFLISKSLLTSYSLTVRNRLSSWRISWSLSSVVAADPVVFFFAFIFFVWANFFSFFSFLLFFSSTFATGLASLTFSLAVSVFSFLTDSWTTF